MNSLKSRFIFPALFLFCGAAAAQHNHGGGHAMGGHGQMPAQCPLRMERYEPSLKNTGNGVEITLTARYAGEIAALREKAEAYFASRADMDRSCPARVPGAKTSLEHADGGVKIFITALSPAAIKTVQAAAAYACARKKPAAQRDFITYACPMGHFQGSKPGKCPRCGMELKEKL